MPIPGRMFRRSLRLSSLSSIRFLSKKLPLVSLSLRPAFDFVKKIFYKRFVDRAPELSGNKTRRAIVKLLKTEGEMDSAQLAEQLEITAMAVRQHLYELQKEKLADYEERPVPIGRPVKKWRLTRDADRLFPDAYAELSVALIEAVGSSFGERGLRR